MRFYKSILIFIGIVFLNSALTISAQKVEPVSKAKRPKIGVVLSGGGARGIAHIGVLQWFEENHIPVDYVVGTSMGGLVGGMYAVGKTPAEMRQIVENIDWDQVLQDAPSQKELSYRRKQDKRESQNSIDFGLKNGVSIPAGLNSGHKVSLILDRLTLPYSTVENFNDLVLPFRCVATDMVTGRPVVMQSGSLSTALRATMAIPGVFALVERDGKILADGGLVNNIPTNVVKDMGADIIIAIDIGTPLGDKKTLENIGGILSQTVGVALIGNDRRNLGLADIIVSPDLGNYGTFSFSANKELYEMGYKGATEKAVVLKKFALDDAAWAEYIETRNARRRSEIPVPQGITVAENNLKSVERRNIEERLRDNVGVPVNADKIEKQINEIRGEGRLDTIGYEIDNKNGTDILAIRTKQKTYGPPFFNPSFVIETAGSDNVFTTLGGRFTFFDLAGYRSELRADVKFGSEAELSGEFYKPLGNNGYFIAPRAYYEREIRNLFQGNSRIATYNISRTGIGLDTGYTFRSSEFRVGYDLANVKARVRVGDPVLPTIRGNESRVFARYDIDTTNSAIIPTEGVRFTGDLRYTFRSPGADRKYAQGEANATYFRKIGGKGIGFLSGGAGTSFNRFAAPADRFTLGGTLRLSAYSRDQFIGNNYLFTSGGYLREIYSLPSIIGGKVYAFGAIETGGAFDRFATSNYFSNATGGIIISTAFGPVSVGGAFGEAGNRKVFFSLGRIF
jgi:NTE family protein